MHTGGQAEILRHMPQHAAPPPTAHAAGLAAEAEVAALLRAEGFTIHAQRLRTPRGEIDLVAEQDGLLVFVEVKQRASLAEAAYALQPRQQARLLAAAEIILAEHPDWGRAGVRFDVILVDAQGRLRRLRDVLRAG